MDSDWNVTPSAGQHAATYLFRHLHRYIVLLECLGTQRCTKLQVQTICWKCRNIPQKEWEYRISKQYPCFQKSGIGVGSWISTNAAHCWPSLLSCSFALWWIPILGALKGTVTYLFSKMESGFLKCHKSDLSSLFYLHLPGFFNKPRVKVSRYWGSDSPMAALRWGHIQCPGAQGINVETEGDGRAFGHFKAWDGRRDETVRDIRKRLCKIMDVMIWWSHLTRCNRRW